MRISFLYAILVIFFLFAFSIFFIGGKRIARAVSCAGHNVRGWAWSANIGWISLTCANTVGPEDYGLDLNYNTGYFTPSSYAWSSNAGWIHFAPLGLYPSCGGCPNYAARYATSTGKIYGWAKIVGWGDDGWIKLGPFTVGDYGVKINPDRSLAGWAFNADFAGRGAGAGWISFSSANPETGLGEPAYIPEFNAPYFKGEGDIYGKGGIITFLSPPSGNPNATFLIHANGAISPTVVSGAGGALPYKDPAFGNINFPQSSNQYKNILGTIDRAGLTAGKYGGVTEYGGNCGANMNISAAPGLGANPVLDGKVFYSRKTFTINSPVTFRLGAGSQKGRGTIVIDCDLIINANMSYESGSLTSSIEQLPSVAWIVKGDIIINPSVTRIAGVFYTEGDNGFITGSTNDPRTDQRLEVSGLIMAKRFRFERLYSDASGSPAEKVSYDGRVWLNTPPGLEDIVRGLPVFREVPP